MSIVTVKKNTYTVEPLYQWDKDQTLEIRGLSLAKIPEVHFAHEGMGRAIVRQSAMDAAGVVTVDVPNSLLQKPYTVHVYVCAYTGGTFETLYKFDIPVKARECPADYTLTDDPEVYSFNALENQVVNALAAVEKACEEAVKACDERATRMEAHTHDASAINSGTLPVERGGTGMSTAPSMLVDLARTTAASPHTAAPRPGVTGVLPLSHGGTGATTAEAALAALGAQRIKTGSYTGAGTDGASNSTIINLGITPKLLIVAERGGANMMIVFANGESGLVLKANNSSVGDANSMSIAFAQWGTTVEFYTTKTNYKGQYQYNESGKTYDYIAFG